MNTYMKHEARLSLRRAMICGLVWLLAMTTLAAAQSRSRHAQLSSAVIDEGARAPLAGAEPLLARLAVDQGKLSAGERLEGMRLVLRRGASEQARLSQYLEDVQRPGSKLYRQWMTPEQFGENFGASDADVAAVSGWLRSHGFSVDSVSKSRMIVVFSGAEAQFESAFRAEMHHYKINGEERVANSSTPSVPAALAPAVFGVATLGNAAHSPMHTSPKAAQIGSDGRWRSSANAASADGRAAAPQFTTKVNGSYLTVVGPSDFAEIYNVKPLWNKGLKGEDQSIAIVAESNIAQSDVAAFRKSFGLPEGKVNVIVIGPDPGLQSSGSEGEAALDVQWAGAIAPSATINLLVASSTKTQFGIAIAAEYAIENNLSPVLNMSWGACEMGLQAAGNQYWNELWAQAAAQGISVMVSSGDAGSVACDQNQYFANYGQQVSGIASTEYATAVGGTDLYGNIEGAGKYWTQTNDPVTLQSAKSYITESAWNDSCANPLILQNAADFGFTETSAAALCSNEFSLLNTVGGGGGVSNCTSSDGAKQSSCTGGNAAPLWQYGFAGVDAKSKRHVPDVSFFSGGGLWGAAYAFCEADASSSDYCQNQNGDMKVLTAGGTSFAAPAFAGVVALLNQQQGGRLGNVNKYLYSLAGRQYADATLAADCQSGSGQDSGACIFHDVVAGSIVEPCRTGTLVDPVTGALCAPDDGSNSYYGVTPGYVAKAGYDLATGLGSINIGNLAAAWSSAVANDSAASVAHTVDLSQVAYGSDAAAVINVTGASSTPTGVVSLMSTDANGSTIVAAAGWLEQGEAKLTFNALVPGQHQLYAVYGGDANYGAAKSSPTSFVVDRAAVALSPSASVATIVAASSSTLTVTIKDDGKALSPSGSVVVANQTSGAVIGSAKLSRFVDAASGNVWAQASFKVTGDMLQEGVNSISVDYAGDSNFLPAAQQTLKLSFKPYYALTSSLSQIDLSMAGGGSASASIKVSANAGGKVDAAALSLSCDAATTQGLSCSFGAPTVNADGSLSYPMTLVANNPRPVAQVGAARRFNLFTKGASLLIFGCVGFFGLRRRWARLALLGAALAIASLLAACGGSSRDASSPAVTNVLSVSNANPSYGSSLTLVSTLSPVSNSAKPSGAVLFYDGANLLGSAQVSDGKASFSLSTLSVGAHALTASYSGDSTFMPSSSAVANVNVAMTTNVTVTVRDSAGNRSQLSLPVNIH